MTSKDRTQCYDSVAVNFDRFQEVLRSVTFLESSLLKQIFIKYNRTSAEMTEYEFFNRFIKVFKNQKHHFYGFLSFFDKMGSRFFSHQRAHKHTFTRPTKKLFEKRRQKSNQFRPESESLGVLGGLRHLTLLQVSASLYLFRTQLLRATLFVEILWSDLDFWAKLSVENETANLRPFSLTFLPSYHFFVCTFAEIDVWLQL